MIPNIVRNVAAVAFASLLLAGCSTAEDLAAKDTGTASDTSTATDPEPIEVPDGHASCAAFADGGDDSLLERVPGALTGIGPELGSDQLDELLAIHRGIERAADDAPTELARALERLNEPFQEVADLFAAGGGELNMDTSHVMEDVTAVMAACVNLGYTVAED